MWKENCFTFWSELFSSFNLGLLTEKQTRLVLKSKLFFFFQSRIAYCIQMAGLLLKSVYYWQFHIWRDLFCHLPKKCSRELAPTNSKMEEERIQMLWFEKQTKCTVIILYWDKTLLIFNKLSLLILETLFALCGTLLIIVMLIKSWSFKSKQVDPRTSTIKTQKEKI